MTTPWRSARSRSRDFRHGLLGDLLLSAEKLLGGSLSVNLEDVHGAGVAGAELCLWSADSGRALLVREPSEDGRLTLQELPAGQYRIEVSCDLGRRDLGSLWLAPGETRDLGLLRFDALGWISLSRQDGDAPNYLLWSALADVFARAASFVRPLHAVERALPRASPCGPVAMY